MNANGFADNSPWHAEPSAAERRASVAPPMIVETVDDILRRKISIDLRDALHECRDLDVPLSDIRESVDRIATHFNRHADAGGTLPVMDGKRLSTEISQVEYLIDRLLAKGQPTMLGGVFKGLKTNIAIDLTLSLSLGVRFLGEFPVNRPVRTLLLSGESGQATIRETAERIAVSKGYPLAQFENARFGFELPRLGDAASMAKLARTLKAEKIEVLILDPVYLLLPVDVEAASIFKMGALLRDVSALCAECGVTLILVHHLKRGINRDPHDPPELADLAWAGFAEFARQWLLIGRREPYDPDSGGVHRLWLNVGGSAGHCGLWGVDVDERPERIDGSRTWQVSVLNARQARQEVDHEQGERREMQKEAKRQRTIEADVQKILKSASSFPEGSTESQIRARAGLNTGRFAPAFAEVLSRKQVESCKVARGNGRTYDGYKFNRTLGQIQSDTVSD